MMSYEHLSPELREIAIKRQMEFDNFSFNGKDDGADMSDWDDPVKLKEIAKCYEDGQKRKQSKNVYNTPLDPLECFRVSQTPISAMYERTMWCNIFDGVYTDKFGNLCGEQMLNSAGFQIFAGNSSVGKSMLVSEIALTLLRLNEAREVYYFNFDASAQTFAHRGQADLIATFQKQGRFIPMRQNELEQNDINVANTLQALIEKGCELYGVVFVIDVLSYMVSDVNKGNLINEFLSKLRALCNQCAMCIVIAHNNKLGQIFAGSAEIKNKPDNLVQISLDESLPNERDKLHLKLERTKGKEAFFHYHRFLKITIDLALPCAQRLIFRGFDDEIIKPTPLQTELKEQIHEVLKNCDKISQGELLAKIGRDKNDQTALKVLREHNTLEGKFLWFANKIKRDDGKWGVEYSLKPFKSIVAEFTNLPKLA